MAYTPDYWTLLRRRNPDLNWVGEVGDRQHDTVALDLTGLGEYVHLHPGFNSQEVGGVMPPNIAVNIHIENPIIDNTALITCLNGQIMARGGERKSSIDTDVRLKFLIGKPLDTDVNGLEITQGRQMWENCLDWHSRKLRELINAIERCNQV
jgi:hypothetical protein